MDTHEFLNEAAESSAELIDLIDGGIGLMNFLIDLDLEQLTPRQWSDFLECFEGVKNLLSLYRQTAVVGMRMAESSDEYVKTLIETANKLD